MLMDEQAFASGLPSLGAVVARRYRIHSVVAASDHAVTFRATHVQSGDSVALRVGRPSAGEEGQEARLLRIGRVMSELANAHLARVLAGGVLRNGAPFLVTEWLDGCSLATLLESGSLPLEVAVDYVLQASEALVELHARGIVHRDLDPSKLFVVRGIDGKPCVKLLGCAHAKVSAKDDALPPTLGPAAYRSPEELSGEAVDGRADTWALGVVLFEALTRSLPFGNGSPAEVLTAIRSALRALVSNTDARLPKILDDVLGRCLKARRRGRLHHIRSLAHALAPFGGPEGSAQLARIRAVARTAGRLPKAVLAGGFTEPLLADVSNDRPSAPPTTSSVRPPGRRVRELEPETAPARSRMAWVGAPAVIVASLLVTLLFSRGTIQDPRPGFAAEAPVGPAARAAVTMTSAELPAPSSGAATLMPSASAPPVVESLNATAMTVTATPQAPRRFFSPPPRGVNPPAKRSRHPRLSTTVFPGDPSPEPFDNRK